MATMTANRPLRLATLFLTGAVLAAVVVVARYRPSTRAPVHPTPPAPRAATIAAPAAQRSASALRMMEQQVRLQPQNRDARLQLARLYFQSFDYARSLRELRILEQQYPRDPGVYLRQAVVLKSNGRPDAAEKAVRRALALQPGSAQAELLLGDIQLDRRQFREALKVFDRQLQSQPESIAALMGKSRTLERLYLAQEPVKVDELLAPVEKAAAIAPNDPRVLSMLAKMKFAYLITPADTAAAETAALRAVQLDPEESQAYVTLAQIYLSRAPTADNIRKVAEYAARAEALNVNDPRPPFLIGRVALLQNDAPRAAEALERSLELGPMPETVTQLAAVHRRAGNLERAGYYAAIYERYMNLMARRDALQAAQKRQPKVVRHYHGLAQLYLEAGAPDKAEQWLAKARQVRPRDRTGGKLLTQAHDLRKKGPHAPLLRIP